MLAFEREGVAWDVIMCSVHMAHTRAFVDSNGRNWSDPAEHGGRGISVRRILKAQTTSCYVVNGGYAPKLLSTFMHSAKRIQSAERLPSR